MKSAVRVGSQLWFALLLRPDGRNGRVRGDGLWPISLPILHIDMYKYIYIYIYIIHII